MIDERLIESNLELLSKKELYFCSIYKKKFFDSIADDTDKIKMNYDLENTDTQSTVLLVNEENLSNILQAERAYDVFGGTMDGKREGVAQLPFYLYYDEKQFVRFIQNNNIADLCRKYRVVILVGMEEFENFFCRFDVIYPTIVMGDIDQKITMRFAEIGKQRDRIFYEIVNEIRSYYCHSGDAICKRVLDGRAKICILKNYFEPDKFRDFYRQFERVMEERGYTVIICDEAGPVFRTHEIFNIYQYRPDIIFQINKSRNGGTFEGERINIEYADNLIFINWLQDIYPEAWNEQYALCLKKRDYIFSQFDKDILRRYGFRDQNMIYGGIMPADSQHFSVYTPSMQEHGRSDYDLCFFGTVMDEQSASSWMYGELMLFFSSEQILHVCDVLFDLLEGIYDPYTQKYVIDLELVNHCVDQLQSDLHCNNIEKMLIFRIFMVMRYNTLRKLVLKHLASQKKYKIVLYGRVDPEIEGIDFGGYISDRIELSKAIQSCKICMQINPDMTMNQRVAEGLLSHMVVMVYKMEDKDDMSSAAHYLEEQEGICYFRSKRELLEKCDWLLRDKELREKIAEAGYQKAIRTLTPEHIFAYLMEELKRKVKSEGGEEEWR